LRLNPLYRLAFNTRDAYSRYLWNRNPPAVGAVHRDVPYVEGGRRKQTLDVIVPAGEPPYPVIVYIHGGGWHFGDKKSPERICKCFAHQDYIVFNINHRLAPRHDVREQPGDVGRAVLWARKNAGRYGGDAGRLFLAGESSGAHLASLYAAAATDRQLAQALSIEEPVPAACIRGLLLFYGVYDLESALVSSSKTTRAATRGFLGGVGGAAGGLARLASPLRHVSAGYPPVFLCSGDVDEIHGQSVRFDKALADAGVANVSVFFRHDAGEIAPHAFLGAYTMETSRTAMREALAFLDKVTAA